MSIRTGSSFRTVVRFSLGLVCSLLILTAAPEAVADKFLEGQMAAHDGNHEAALRAWLPLARDGHVKAQYAVGALFAEGRGTTQDLSTAFDWWLQAAAQSHVRAQFNVAAMYKNGVGVGQNEVEAAHWISAAANLGDRDSQVQLSQFYRDGFGVGQNPVTAYMWLEIARLGGHPSIAKALKASASLLSEEQIIEAQKRAVSWLERKSVD